MAENFAGFSPSSGLPRQRAMSFTEAVRTCWMEKFSRFEGRASRSEYWWNYLAVAVGNVVLSTLAPTSVLFAVLAFVYGVAAFIVMLTAATRRLHDTGRSGWWQLLGITIIGAIPLLYFLCKASEQSPNQYGDIPCLESAGWA